MESMCIRNVALEAAAVLLIDRVDEADPVLVWQVRRSQRLASCCFSKLAGICSGVGYKVCEVCS
jgi:hypothetical protein